MLLQQRWTVKNFVLIVSRGLTREIDSVKAIGSKDVGGVSEESNVINSDEYAKEFQNVFNSVSVVEFDPRLLRESRQVEIDFCESVARVP